jgi:hypothetical protein
MAFLKPIFDVCLSFLFKPMMRLPEQSRTQPLART